MRDKLHAWWNKKVPLWWGIVGGTTLFFALLLIVGFMQHLNK